MTKGIMVLSVCAGLALLIAIAASCGSHQWKKKTDALRDRLSASR